VPAGISAGVDMAQIVIERYYGKEERFHLRINCLVAVKEDWTAEKKPNGIGLRKFLRWEVARDQEREGHSRTWLKVFAFVLFVLMLTCALSVCDL
jgi:hypothetical protein